jgi:hypothetical protein
MLKVYADQQLAGKLFKPESAPSQYHFAYESKSWCAQPTVQPTPAGECATSL